nr:Chain B, Initiator protein NS1 [Human parvovirus B19]8F2Q_C Chain C, Initiator protein NS1 [Human parvovirus B19]
GACHAKKPRIT